MDEATVIARLGALRAPDVEPSRERAIVAVTAGLREAAPDRRPRRLGLVGRGASVATSAAGHPGRPPAPAPATGLPGRPPAPAPATGLPGRPPAPALAGRIRDVLRARRSRLLVPALAVACLAAAILAVTSLGGGPAGPTAPAYGAELVRFARSTPLLLLEQPGWHVSDVIEGPGAEGQMNFTRRSGSAADVAELNWRVGPLESWLRDRAASSDLRTSAPVLGTIAHVFRYEGGRPGERSFTALWDEAGRVLEFRSVAADPSAFERQLDALRQVGPQRWLEAMPPKVIKASDHGSAVAEMLRGVPLPAGFRAAQIPDAGVTTDRYQLGAAVAGTVACRWFAQWGEDLGQGDAKGAAEAERVLAGAKDWPVLRAMEAAGAYPQILEEYAAAMPSREFFGRPLLPDVASGLGCAALGVKLPPGPRASAAP